MIAKARYDENGIPLSTTISSLAEAHGGLSYRGFPLRDCFARAASYEEVAWLLLQGAQPTPKELATFRRHIAAARTLPDELRLSLRALPASAHPMQVLRHTVTWLGMTKSAAHGAAEWQSCAVMLGALPAALCYWHHHRRGEQRIRGNISAPSVAVHLLHLLYGKEPEAAQARALDRSLILYAEHVVNASSFTARVIASTGADYHSAIAGAIGALSGPLHGGANEAVLSFLSGCATPALALRRAESWLASGKRVPGFGHRVYRRTDPRSQMHRELVEMLIAAGADEKRHRVALALENYMWERKRLPANVDFHAATLYSLLGIPADFFTPVFALARLAGWSAHITEQRATGRLIQPLADPAAPPLRLWPKT
ncbi:MAG: citrate/2-methylcitrate synthase [Steroidobacteraceae bacterium]